MRSLNQYSFVVIAVVLLAGLWFLLRHRAGFVRWPALAGAALLMAIFAWTMRTGSGDVRSPADLDRALAGSMPVVLEFYSDY